MLVSSDFLDSEYCYSVEMNRALERRAQGLCDVVPVVLRPCVWQVPQLRDLKAIPADGKAVIKWPSHDEAFEDITRHLMALLGHRANRSSSGGGPTFQAAPPTTTAAPEGLGQVIPVRRSSNLALPRRFTDQDKHDFLQESFVFIKAYFANSLEELGARNSGTEGRLHEISNRAFQAFVFRDGKEEAACYIRIGGAFSKYAIGYSQGARTDDNSYNGMLSVDADDEKIFLTANLTWSGQQGTKLTHEGAAEHFWEQFISPMQRYR